MSNYSCHLYYLVLDWSDPFIIAYFIHRKVYSQPRNMRAVFLNLVTAADVLTLNTIDIHWSMSRSLDPEYIYIRTKKPVFSKVPRDI